MSLEDQDRISQLPVSLIHHILSFLSTKEALVTYTLSTTWKSLWNSIPKLDFKDWQSPTSVDVHLKTEGFMNFMDRIMHRRDFSTLQLFRLYCNEPCDESRANEWISTVISHRVEHLSLWIHLKRPYVFPCCIFTCQSLTMLVLGLDSVFKLPTSVSLPKLRTLCLSVRQFEDEYSIQELLSNCLVLEQLYIKCSWWGNMKNVCISHPILHSMYLLTPEDVTDDGLRSCTVTIHLPKLYYFTYACSIAKDYVLHLPSLGHPGIEIRCQKKYRKVRRQEVGYGLTKLLRGLSNAQSLSLSGKTLKALSYAGDQSVDLPRFYDLTKLRVDQEFPYSANRALMNFLRLLPNLEKIVFDGGLVGSQSDDLRLDIVPQCLLQQLKRFKFRRFDGSKRDISVLKVFLKNALVLNLMTVVSSFPLSETTKEQIRKLPRGSESCVIEFCVQES